MLGGTLSLRTRGRQNVNEAKEDALGREGPWGLELGINHSSVVKQHRVYFGTFISGECLCWWASNNGEAIVFRLFCMYSVWVCVSWEIILRESLSREPVNSFYF